MQGVDVGGVLNSDRLRKVSSVRCKGVLCLDRSLSCDIKQLYPKQTKAMDDKIQALMKTTVDVDKAKTQEVISEIYKAMPGWKCKIVEEVMGDIKRRRSFLETKIENFWCHQGG